VGDHVQGGQAGGGTVAKTDGQGAVRRTTGESVMATSRS
jgi:hypothetical protein